MNGMKTLTFVRNANWWGSIGLCCQWRQPHGDPRDDPEKLAGSPSDPWQRPLLYGQSHRKGDFSKKNAASVTSWPSSWGRLTKNKCLIDNGREQGDECWTIYWSEETGGLSQQELSEGIWGKPLWVNLKTTVKHRPSKFWSNCVIGSACHWSTCFPWMLQRPKSRKISKSRILLDHERVWTVGCIAKSNRSKADRWTSIKSAIWLFKRLWNDF